MSVTGGAQGIGRPIARGGAGAQAVAIVGRDAAKGDEAAEKISSPGAACAFFSVDRAGPTTGSLIDQEQLVIGAFG